MTEVTEAGESGTSESGQVSQRGDTGDKSARSHGLCRRTLEAILLDFFSALQPLVKGSLRHALLAAATCSKEELGRGAGRLRGFSLLAADFIVDDMLDVHLVSFTTDPHLQIPESKVRATSFCLVFVRLVHDIR